MIAIGTQIVVVLMVNNDGLKGWDPVDGLTSGLRRLSDIALYVPREPRIFPVFYEQLFASSPVPLTRAPLERIAALGEPLAHGSELLDLPVTSSIVHSCDPSHLAATHIVTVPFFLFAGARIDTIDLHRGEGSYRISLKRGVELVQGVGIFPFLRDVKMYLHGPLCFELDTGEVKIFFQLIPLDEHRHLMEVSLYQTGSHGELLDALLPKIGEFFVRVSMAEDSFYLSKLEYGATEAVLGEVDPYAGALPGLTVYRALYKEVLPQVLPASYMIAKGLVL